MARSKENSFLPSILPADEPEGDFLEYYSKLNLVAAPAAALLSYARNRDAKWALIHGMIGLPYLTYVGLRAVSLLEGKALLEAEQELENLA